nr:purine-binding chemotaxis protein CheW [Bacilli bacterium]
MQESMKCIVFGLAGEDFGVDVAQVMSIERMEEIVFVPKAPHFVKGIMNLRGSVIPVIDLRERLSLPMKEQTSETRLIVVRVYEQDVAFIVDSAHDVMDIDGSQIDPTPRTFVSVDAAFLKGVAKLKEKLLVILSLENILAEHELVETAKIARS